jgi:hypothetical protein
MPNIGPAALSMQTRHAFQKKLSLPLEKRRFAVLKFKEKLGRAYVRYIFSCDIVVRPIEKNFSHR